MRRLVAEQRLPRLAHARLEVAHGGARCANPPGMLRNVWCRMRAYTLTVPDLMDVDTAQPTALVTLIAA